MLNYHGGSHPTNLQTLMSSTTINMAEQPLPLFWSTTFMFKYSELIFEMAKDQKRQLIKKQYILLWHTNTNG